ncbi:MAG: DUF763 domain-containing protein, partial [Candidatus Omnitrophica bacterium]|nr:DUF763 domain-containing protein [Candidatus Omnitrophota bacterium]
TTVCGALKEALKDVQNDLGIFVCGGKGATSRKTPFEIEALAEKRLINADAEKLKYASRMSAKVDNTAIQDGYQLYHHTFIVDKNGKWAVIQQGMNENTKWARRYHWLGDEVSDFVVEPHKAICCDQKNENTLNLVAKESSGAREVCGKLSCDTPEKTVKEYSRILELKMPSYHDVKQRDILPKNLKKILITTYENKPENFEKLLGIQGVGPGTVRALALVSELVYGEKPSFQDPVRFSFAHGGKDGFPYPVNRPRYDGTISFLQDAVSKAKVGDSEKMKALKRLTVFSGTK